MNDSNQNPAGSNPPNPEQVTPGVADTQKHEGITAFKFLMAAFVVIIIIGSITPTAGWIGFPIFGIGLLSSISFIAKASRQAKHYGPALRIFITLGGLGIGFVILIIAVIAAISASAYKDPGVFNFGLIKF